MDAAAADQEAPCAAFGACRHEACDAEDHVHEVGQPRRLDQRVQTRSGLKPRSAPAADFWNPHTVRSEVTDRLLVISERHLRSALERYVAHYNQRRPHRALQLRPPRPDHALPSESAGTPYAGRSSEA
ncbi:integrase core domain-containing protein [Kibdelosporangium aridum]|uniref:integrase core domain-containing protein n=1 Tax=Kibdelosporangium aridum TaxID=2030 RepID=UPI000A0426D8|nr:integrase core domain-containing protein [Kibdelosporangium aridum]